MTAGRKDTRGRVVLYTAVAALTVVLMALAVAAWRAGKVNRAAEDKADRLIAALAELGTAVPERDQVVRLFGDDGGPVCADPAGAARRAASLGVLSTGAGGPGTRPAVAGAKLVEGQLAVVTIYCPDRLSEFEEYVSGLRAAGISE
ncbi:hypothetical protein [Amycolatopsis sp. YIM 10]|uniref:hypothetical protein n=1 Tax=Amycolatopsis sp. YIM 10 TaxID=2653857 RepID=UPI00129026E4|nr:hypothetical protein [Amycolatopsis sp. YIM 10]QFU88948.1 hypothetical protein YIM_18840 [Amycolatopsis sp. YIM 10]